MSDAQKIEGVGGRISGLMLAVLSVLLLWGGGVGWDEIRIILIIVGSLFAVWVVVTGLLWIWNRNTLAKLSAWLEGAPSGLSALGTSELLGRIEHANLKNRAVVFPLLDEVCERYIALEEEARTPIRDFFAEEYPRLRVLLKYAHLSARKLKIKASHPGCDESSRAIILRRGLAAVSINNLQTDWRECQEALEALFKAALATELAPAAYFEEISNLSSDVSPHPQITDHPSMRGFLSELLEQFQR